MSVTCDMSVVFSRYSAFPPRYNWNIVESGVKHHEPNHLLRTQTHRYLGTRYIPTFFQTTNIWYHILRFLCSVYLFVNYRPFCIGPLSSSSSLSKSWDQAHEEGVRFVTLSCPRFFRPLATFIGTISWYLPEREALGGFHRVHPCWYLPEREALGGFHRVHPGSILTNRHASYNWTTVLLNVDGKHTYIWSYIFIVFIYWNKI